jgi:glucuronate isomerase
LNPADNEAFATLTGSFSEDGVPGKIQFGPGWWYNDQYEGIRKQLTDLANYGLLSRFIGMTTDSRSVFSFSRHEYFRRILCNLLAEWVEADVLPNSFEMLSKLVSDISYNNSKKYFDEYAQPGKDGEYK